MGQEEEHLKLFVKQSRSIGTEGIAAIGFGLGDKFDLTTNQKTFDAVYCIDENEWNGKVSLQLRLRDIK
jgi:single-stranded-DNA-specific exonuclease